MTLTILLPDETQVKLEKRAKAIKWSVEKMAAHLLDDVLDDPTPTLEEVVARTKNLPPTLILPDKVDIRAWREALSDPPDAPDFDEEVWTRQWAAVEEEMRAITKANAIAEGLE
ncbi:MAG: hypothetical protein HY328_09325 [Chloroflexi bacterium]|nr:hypothetical protein [Chloroflexota bacterium]